MADEWREVTLGDLVKIEHGWAFKGEHFSTELSGKPIVVGVGNFQYNGGFRFDSTTLKEYRSEFPEQYLLRPGDTLLIMTCQTAGGEILGIPGRIPDDGRSYLHNQRMGKVVIKEPDQVSLDFLYYLFLSRDFNQWVVASASGTKILHTAPSRIESYGFRLPPIGAQENIAALLGALDQKVELNRRTNETIDRLNRAMFKDWFVDFGPVRALAEGRPPAGVGTRFAPLFPARFDANELPVGWNQTSIYEFTDVIYGAPFASQHFNEAGLGLPLLRIRDLEDHNPKVFTNEAHPKGHQVVAGDIVVGMDGEFRVHIWNGPPSWLNQRMCLFKPKPGVSRVFVANAVRPLMDFLERAKVGTTVIHLGKLDIDIMTFVHPPTPVLDAFGSIADPLLEKSVKNSLESSTLIALRDLLLPRLVSGQLSIRAAEKLLEAV